MLKPATSTQRIIHNPTGIDTKFLLDNSYIPAFEYILHRAIRLAAPTIAKSRK